MQDSNLTSSDTLDDNPDLVSQVKRLAGQQHLGQLFAAGLLKQPEDSDQDAAASVMAHPDFSKKEKSTSSLRSAASDKLSKRLNKLLEDLGNTTPISDEKGAQKLVGKAHMFLMKTPGFSRMKADDKNRVVHKILGLAGKGDLDNLHEIIEHETQHAKGRDSINSKVKSLFEGSYPKEMPVGKDEHDRVNEYVDHNELHNRLNDQNGIQNFAEGGEVAPKPPVLNDRVATAFPGQATVMGAAKNRVHNYLNALKPRKEMGLPFDKDMKSPHKEKNYKSAVEMAARPLSVLDRLHDGSINTREFQHFANMHPEIHDLLKKKLTGKITEMQASDGKRPPFKTRQALSMFMTQPMEKSLSPMAIQAAQATFIQQPQEQPNPQGPQKPKANKAGSKEIAKGSATAMTPIQAAEKREVQKD